MILELDCGNTFTKWRLVDELFHVIESGKFSTNASDFSDEFNFTTAIHQVWVSSVAGIDFNQQLQTFCETQWNTLPKFAKTQRRILGVTNGYYYPDQLGIDRWLAMIAAFLQLKSACCIIDCGTALTIDFVNAGGVHLGGYIVPGLSLLTSSLQTSTKEIVEKLAEGKQHDLVHLHLGVTTDQAIVYGREMMLTSFIEHVVSEQNQLNNCVFQTMITGGDAPEIRKQLNFSVIWEPDLVFAGLEWVMRSGRND